MVTLRNFFKKKTVKETVLLCLNSIMAGVLLSIAAAVYLICYKQLDNKIVGSLLFSFGLLVIILFEFKLFTGMVANLPYTPVKKFWTLPVCFIFNTFGTFLGALCFKGTGLATNSSDNGLIELCKAVVEGKIANTPGQMFFSAVLCGICITIAVLGCRITKEKSLSGSLIIVLAIMVFILSGFEHSVANMYYIFMAGDWSGSVWMLILMGILGNIVGGSIIPLYKLYEGKKYVTAPAIVVAPAEIDNKEKEEKPQ